MIGLIGSGRPGGDGKPMVYTVPWSPLIAERPGAQMPGLAYRKMIEVVRYLESEGVAHDAHRVRDEMFVRAALQGADPEHCVITAFSLRLALELGLLPGVAS